MSVSEDELVDRMTKKHAMSSTAVHVVLAALRSGGGRMAQFSHADFGGMSQWSPGMSMVGDMFNTQLKAKLDALCSDIAAHLDSSEMARFGTMNSSISMVLVDFSATFSSSSFVSKARRSVSYFSNPRVGRDRRSVFLCSWSGSLRLA